MFRPTYERIMGKLTAFCLPCFLLVLPGCSTLTPVDPQTVSENFVFIQDGKTSKEEIITRFGAQNNNFSYEGGRILIYKMCEVNGQLRLPSEPENRSCGNLSKYNLVLVFGPDDLVERHSVVRKR